jgi:hypothetical protein
METAMSKNTAPMTVINAPDVADLKTLVDDLLTQILPRSGSSSEGPGDDARIFKSGLELIGLKLQVGTQVTISIVFAGKDAPKLEPLALPGLDTPPT